MATFGKTTVGADVNLRIDMKDGCRYLLGENGKATSIHVYFNTSGFHAKAAVYRDSLGVPGALIVASASELISSVGWHTFSITPTDLTAGYYWLSVVCDDTSAQGRMGAGLTNQHCWMFPPTVYVTEFTDPFGTPAGYEAKATSIYCTYTPTPPPAPPTPPSATQGTLIVYAVAGSEEVKASVQIVETQKQYDTAFLEYLDEGTYQLVASYKGQTLKQTVSITAEQSSIVTFTFTLTYLLQIVSDPSPVTFTLNGVEEATPFNQTLPSGTYTLVMPPSVFVGADEYIFEQWENGSVEPIRILSLTRNYNQAAQATYRLKQVEGAAPASQRQIKDALRQVMGKEGDLSPSNPLPVSEITPTTVYNGQITIAAAAVPLSATSVPIKTVSLENDPDGNVVYVGNSGVTAVNGRRLWPGATLDVAIDNLNKIYVVGTVGDVISYIAVN